MAGNVIGSNSNNTSQSHVSGSLQDHESSSHKRGRRSPETVREDDFVEYFLFPPIESNEDSHQEKVLSSILDKVQKIVTKYSEGYLWHKDGFKLGIRTSASNILSHIEGKADNLPPHLYGISHYGDNIEDEWFMVFMLRQLTKEITGLIARVHDSDGEFMLIEAADYLPSWANPDTCENRVYIYDGSVHLVPPDSPDSPETSVPQALLKIRKEPSLTLASPDIQNSIKNKLDGYPERIKDNIHRATAYVPSGVAAILRRKPQLIAPAIQAFCNRDPMDLRACRAMKYFPPENRVPYRVTFTKCLYAMLTSSKYFPDRVTGWKLPPGNSKEYKSHILGVKIACGFEILASQGNCKCGVDGDKAWHAYLKQLKEKGYFKDFLEDSKDYNVLLGKAKEYYLNHRDTMQCSTTIGQEIVELTKTLEFDPEMLEHLPEQPDDDESWLDVAPEELDKMLQEKYGHKKIFSVNNNSDSSNFTEKLSNFLNQVSDVEGAEFPQDPPLRPPRTKNKNTVDNADNKVNFDPDSFACAVQNILNFVIPEDDSWNSDSDMSEYEDDICPTDENLEDVKMKKYMEEMDKELAGTTIGESFEKKDTFDDIESFKPVDINVNTLKNILESYRSQLGEAGPSSNMLGPMGVRLDPKTEMDVD